TWPRLITSYNEYLRLFGDVFTDGKYMPHAVKAFFDNGGRRVYITRIAGEGATPARGEFAGITVITIGPGLAANRIYVRVGPGSIKGSDGKSKGFRLQVFYWDRLPEGTAPFDPVADEAAKLRLPRPSLT